MAKKQSIDNGVWLVGLPLCATTPTPIVIETLLTSGKLSAESLSVIAPCVVVFFVCLLLKTLQLRGILRSLLLFLVTSLIGYSLQERVDAENTFLSFWQAIIPMSERHGEVKVFLGYSLSDMSYALLAMLLLCFFTLTMGALLKR